MGNRASVVGGFLGRNQSTQRPCCHVKDSDGPATYRRWDMPDRHTGGLSPCPAPGPPDPPAAATPPPDSTETGVFTGLSPASTVYLQSGTGQRPSEALAFSSECRRAGFVRIRWQVSAKAHRADCRTAFVPCKNRVEGEYRDVPTAPFVDQEIDAHLSWWAPVPVVFTGQRGKRLRLEVFFSPRQRGKGTMPTASTYGYDFKKACRLVGLIDVDGKAKYTPRSLRHFFASIALAHGVPIHEVSRWLGHRSVKTTIDIYGYLVPRVWHRCREVLQNAMRPAPLDAAVQSPEEVRPDACTQAAQREGLKGRPSWKALEGCQPGESAEPLFSSRRTISATIVGTSRTTQHTKPNRPASSQ